MDAAVLVALALTAPAAATFTIATRLAQIFSFLINQMKIITKFLPWAILIFFIVFIFINIMQGFSDNSAGIAEIMESTYSLEYNDSSLFRHEILQGISVFQVLRSKARNPISIISYNESNIVFFKIDMADSSSFKSIFALEKAAARRSTGYSYRIIDQIDILQLQAKSGKVQPASRILVNLQGDILNVELKNDSITSYRLLCDKLSIKYDKAGPVDFLWKGKFQEVFH